LNVGRANHSRSNLTDLRVRLKRGPDAFVAAEGVPAQMLFGFRKIDAINEQGHDIVRVNFR
jgi:hypothetical protein